MKLAFSTLGCPDWTFNEMLSTAKDLEFNAIEIRGIEKEVFAPYAKPFLKENIDKSIESIKNINMEVSLLATGACIGIISQAEAAIGEAKVYTDLAAKLSTKYIRIMITTNPQPEEADFDHAVKTYQIICDYAQTKGISPLIETNGILADSLNMKKFIEATNRSNSGVLWDVHHPYRFYNETVEKTFSNIGKYIKYVHVKDSVMENGFPKYKMMGLGDVPVLQALKLLNDNKYDSFISLEWVKRWCPELEEAGIVFSHFINYIHQNFNV